MEFCLSAETLNKSLIGERVNPIHAFAIDLSIFWVMSFDDLSALVLHAFFFPRGNCHMNTTNVIIPATLILIQFFVDYAKFIFGGSGGKNCYSIIEFKTKLLVWCFSSFKNFSNFGGFILYCIYAWIDNKTS